VEYRALLVESRLEVWLVPLLETALPVEKTSFLVSCFLWIPWFRSRPWNSRVSDPSGHGLSISHGIQVAEREVEHWSGRKSVCYHEGAISGMTLVVLVAPPASIVAPSIFRAVGFEPLNVLLACEMSETSVLPAIFADSAALYS
jgi:hypothetical protein